MVLFWSDDLFAWWMQFFSKAVIPPIIQIVVVVVIIIISHKLVNRRWKKLPLENKVICRRRLVVCWSVVSQFQDMIMLGCWHVAVADVLVA